MPDKKDGAKRRMQGNTSLPNNHVHGVEHDELRACDEHPACVPVAAQPETAPVSSELDAIANRIGYPSAHVSQWAKDNPDSAYSLMSRCSCYADATTMRWWRSTPTMWAEIKRLQGFIETACIVEIAVLNPSVADYVKHWEGRTEKAERELAHERMKQPGITKHLKLEQADPAPSVTSPPEKCPQVCPTCGTELCCIHGLPFHVRCEPCEAPDPAPSENSVSPATGTRQQRLSRQCEECASQIGAVLQIGGEYKEVETADLIYKYMRDLFHEITEAAPASVSQDICPHKLPFYNCDICEETARLAANTTECEKCGVGAPLKMQAEMEGAEARR